MKKSILNKRIKLRKDKYYHACDKINNEYKKLIERIDKFRMDSVSEILRLKNKDEKLNELIKIRSKLK